MPKTKAKQKKEKVDVKQIEKEVEAISKEAKGKKGAKDKKAAAAAPKTKKSSKVSSGSISMYLAEIGQYNPLPPEREVELAIRIQNNDEAAMKELVEANLRFVVSVAKKYQGNGLSLADIINEGNLGLIKAAKRFDHTRGFKFISYAVWWIRQSILQALAEQSRLIRLPLNRVGTITKITRAAEKLEAEVERQPKGDEIGNQLEMSGDEVLRAVHQYRRFLSLKLRHPKANLVPTDDIDLIWHTHILDTENYALDCQKLFGSFLHHYPNFGQFGNETQEGMGEMFNETSELWVKEYGEALETPEIFRCSGKKCHAPSNCRCR